MDCLVVSLHWGFEYTEFPSPDQQRLARSLIDAGAHMVVGHHPHIVQGIEDYHAGLIAYSLGNFHFHMNLGDDLLSRGTGVMLRVRRSAQGQLAYKPLPIKLTEHAAVEVTVGKNSEECLARLAQLSGALTGKRINRIRWMKEASRLWFPLQLEACAFRIRRFGIVQLLRMLGWLLRPVNLVYLALYLTGAKHNSTRALFQKRD